MSCRHDDDRARRPGLPAPPEGVYAAFTDAAGQPGAAARDLFQAGLDQCLDKPERALVSR